MRADEAQALARAEEMRVRARREEQDHEFHFRMEESERISKEAVSGKEQREREAALVREVRDQETSRRVEALERRPNDNQSLLSYITLRQANGQMILVMRAQRRDAAIVHLSRMGRLSIHQPTHRLRHRSGSS